MSLTEDFELQIESTCEGKRILWNHNVRIYDEKPTAFRASFRQRTRWAQGHWFVAFKNTGKLFRALFQRKDPLSRVFLHLPVYVQPDALRHSDVPAGGGRADAGLRLAGLASGCADQALRPRAG